MELIVVGVAILILLRASFAISARYLLLPHTPQEPPLIPPRFPIIGHLLGVICNGLDYYSMVTRKHRLPIYTLPLPRSKIYIVNSLHFVSAVDKHARTISFAPFFAEVAKRIMGASQDAVDKFAEDPLGDSDVPGLREATLKAMHTTLTNRVFLEDMTKEAVTSLNSLLTPEDFSVEGEETDLFSWVCRVMTIMSTDVTYGIKKNPFRDDGVRESFWMFDDDFAKVGLNFLPSITAPRGIEGRAIVKEAMVKYYENEGQLSASEMVRARLEVNRGFSISPEDIARFDVGVCHGLLSNIVPAAFWVIYYVFSDPILLDEIKLAISEASLHREPKDHSGSKSTRVNISAITAKCPMIPSLVREALRMNSTNAAFRVILEDTLIDGQYLLKKDALLFIPSADIHHDEAIWGPTANRFDSTRFSTGLKSGLSAKPPPSAYRAWGRGAAVCPGRYFATNEIMIFLIMTVARFDILPTNGAWAAPRRQPHIGAAIVSPADKIGVTFREREDWKGMKLEFYWDSLGL